MEKRRPSAIKSSPHKSLFSVTAVLQDMAIKDDVAKLSNGAEITYLDTGAPEGLTNYRTFLFIHGAAHNKCIRESETC